MKSIVMLMALVVSLVGIGSEVYAEKTYPQVGYNQKTDRFEVLQLTEQQLQMMVGKTASPTVNNREIRKNRNVDGGMMVRRGRVTLAGYFTGTDTYVVGKGDMIWKIAYVFDVSTSQLIQANAVLNRNLIEPGQKLSVSLPMDYGQDGGMMERGLSGSSRNMTPTPPTVSGFPMTPCVASYSDKTSVTCGNCKLVMDGRYSYCPICGSAVGKSLDKAVTAPVIVPNTSNPR